MNTRRELNVRWGETLDEIDRASALVSVWLLLKNDKIAGRITARTSQTKTGYYVVHTAFVLYASENYKLPIYGTETLRGIGFDLANSAISDILNDCREKLKEYYNVALNPVIWNVMNSWENDFKSAGFSVLQAL